ncbi:MAG: hypothetical protein ACTSUO_03300 [Candidatus Thorarchaeota archaeon]
MKIRQGDIHIIFLRGDVVILSKKKYSDWREIQDEYDDFMTSLGSWTAEAVISFYELDFGKDDTDWPFSREQILAFEKSDETILQSG